VSRDPGHWAVGHRCFDHAHGRAANTHLTTIMTAVKLADEIRREAKAGSVEHSALNSRPGANVCIWHISDLPAGPRGCLFIGVDRTPREHHETNASDPKPTFDSACPLDGRGLIRSAIAGGRDPKSHSTIGLREKRR
jgi:hypothetical protein